MVPVRAFAFLPLLLAALPAFAGGITVEGPEAEAGYLRETLPTLIGQVEAELGFEYTGEVTARLARNHDEFRRMVGEKPSWVAAVGIPREATLVVRLSAVGADRGLALRSVLKHELVHVLLPPRLQWRARLPLWFEEGLAQSIGGRINRSDLARLPIAAAAGNLIPLSDLEDSFPRDASGAALAYAQGESVVAVFYQRFGRKGVHRLFDAMASTGSFEAALAREFGMSSARLEADWRAWLEHEAEPWWIAVLRGAFLPLLFFLVSLVAVLAFFRLRRARREEYEELPE